MRHHLTAIVLAAALSIGAAHAAPGFGASSHRLSGDSSPKKASEHKPLTLIEAVLGLIGIELSASVEPIVGETYVDRAGKSKQCDQEKKAEVAKAEEKDGAQGGGSSKGRTRAGEPIYLAF